MSEYEIMKEFQQFGERIFIIAILMILSIFVDFLQFFAFIILLFALANIKKVNFELDDKNLSKFRSKILNSIVLSIVGSIITGIAFGVGFYLYMIGADFIMYLIPINILIYGIILIFISLAFQKKAWHKLHKFFVENKDMFPNHIINPVLDGTDKLEKACKYVMFIITIPIAIIYGLIGLYRLAKLRLLPLYQEESRQKEPIEPKYKPIPVKLKQKSSAKPNYCPSCGNKINRSGRYCFLCGQELTGYKATA